MTFYKDGFNPTIPACNTCKHFKLFSDPPSCAAFRAIPDEILNGEEDHKLPVRGDHGIQYEPIEE
jgi:hypothetical protein